MSAAEAVFGEGGRYVGRNEGRGDTGGVGRGKVREFLSTNEGVAASGGACCLYFGTMLGLAVGGVKAGSSVARGVCIVLLVLLLLLPFCGCLYWVIVHDTSPALPIQMDDSRTASESLIHNADAADAV